MGSSDAKVLKSEQEWREQLTPAQYDVLRKAGTEPPFSGEYVYNKDSGDQTELVFSRDDGLIREHSITKGRNESERINRVITFTGTSLKGPEKSVAFLKLADTAIDVLPPERKPALPNEQPADHKTVSAAGRAQGIALEFGKGRVVVLGEAAMLTAQVTPQGLRFGINFSDTDNRQLALNIMHWLTRVLK